VRRLKVIGGHCETKQRDEAIGCNSGDGASRHEGRKSNLTR